MHVGFSFRADSSVNAITFNGTTLLDNISARPLSQVSTGWR
jgi:hypothetical protein